MKRRTGPQKSSGSEKRRAPRLPGRFWIEVEGLDDVRRLRVGDLSTSGVSFAVDVPITPIEPLGSARWITIASEDRRRSVDTIGRLIRTVALAEQGGQPTYLVAFELLPESQDGREALAALVAYVKALASNRPTPTGTQKLGPRPASPATVASVPRRRVTPPQLRRLLVEADRPLPPGGTLRLELHHEEHGSMIQVEGTVRAEPLRSSLDAQGRYLVAVELTPRRAGKSGGLPPPEPLLPDGGDELGALEVGGRASHLAGRLGAISLGGLFSLLELEGTSGLLVVRQGGRHAAIYLRGGRIVDFESSVGGADPRSELAAMLSWSGGDFDLTDLEVERPERFSGMTTTQLLLDVCREADEHSQDES